MESSGPLRPCRKSSNFQALKLVVDAHFFPPAFISTCAVFSLLADSCRVTNLPVTSVFSVNESWGGRRLKTHSPANGIAAVNYRPRPKQHLCVLCRKRVEIDHILQIACSENGGVHPHPVHGVDEPISCKSAYHGTASALLTLLNKNLARNAQ